MKIIHLVLGKANPNRMNGVNKVAYQLATTQTTLGYNVSLWGIANTLEKNYPERNFKTVIFQQLKNKLRLDPNLVKALKGLDKNTIVHIHGAFIPEFYQISRLLKKQDVPYIYTPHGSFTEMAMTKNSMIKKLYFRLFETSLIENAKRIQLLGINEFTFLDSLTLKAKKCMIPNGQDLNEIPNYPPNQSKTNPPVFGFCGRLATFHKGLDLMLQAFAKYIHDGNEGTLELIGDSNERASLEKLTKELKIDHLVIFHGKKFGKEKFDLLAGMDIFLHTSRMEGFPTAVLEAAALGKPCITSEATNINSFIRKYNSGFTLLENTPEEIAQTMNVAQQQYYKKELSKLGANARRMVEEEFDWAVIAKQLVEVYSE